MGQAIRVERHDLQAHDGIALGWWRVAPERPLAQPLHLFLTHGTFSDRRVCLSMAEAWAHAGHMAWIMEWRGHGSSSRPAADYTMEDVALLDVDAALRALAEIVPPDQLRVATHSGGGLAVTMALARRPEWQALIARMALYCCQANDAARSMGRRVALCVALRLTQWRGHIPGRALRLGVCDESHHMMRPWFRWNLTGRFLGADGFDYGQAQQAMPMPVMAIAGSKDRWIAPPEACERFWQRFAQARQRGQFVRCGIDHGHRQEHNHVSPMHSAAARAEILPAVVEWLAQPTSCGLAPAIDVHSATHHAATPLAVSAYSSI